MAKCRCVESDEDFGRRVEMRLWQLQAYLAASRAPCVIPYS